MLGKLLRTLRDGEATWAARDAALDAAFDGEAACRGSCCMRCATGGSVGCAGRCVRMGSCVLGKLLRTPHDGRQRGLRRDAAYDWEAVVVQ